MTWISVALLVVSFVVTQVLTPTLPGHKPWWAKLNWDALLDPWVWRTFFSDRWVQYAIAAAIGVALW